MNSRHEIINDREFWSRLEFDLTGWFAEHPKKNYRHYWIDGFIPDGISDSKYGVDVEGTAWVGTSGSEQSAYRFLASIPQSLLVKRTRAYQFVDVSLDAERRELELTIERGASDTAAC